MKAFFTSILLISNLISITLGSYVSGLNRTFDEVENTIVDFYVTLPESEVNNLIKLTQISSSQVQNGGAKNLPDFKYEQTVINIKYHGKEKTYENVSFKTGGMYARSNQKVGYNIKLEKKFLGRKTIRLRPDDGDRSHLRSKICCDIANRMGVPSIQAGFVRLYMNGEYWGLYILMDALKPNWIKQTFNPAEKEVTTLFQCKNGGMNLKANSASKCINANDDFQDISALRQFVTEVNQCKTAAELEKIMDVEVFLKFMAMEWLIGSFDHFLIYGHNFYFYQRESDGKWLIIEHDYDNTFGNGLSTTLWANKGPNQDGSSNTNNNNNNNNNNNWGWNWGWNWGGNNNYRGSEPVKYSFADWEMNLPIINVLVHKNKEQFKSIVREVLVSAFNPAILNPHIDELKEFLLPYVKEDCTPGKDGTLPGRINKKGSKHSTSVAEFEKNIESSLKIWIKTKFEVACNNYGFDPDQIQKEAATYVPSPFDYTHYSLAKPKEEKEPKEEDDNEATTTDVVDHDEETTNVVDNKENEEDTTDVVDNDEDITDVVDHDEETTDVVDDKEEEEECWSEVLGYSCCKKTCKTQYTDKHGQWGVENKQWCGIIEKVCNVKVQEAQCYGEITGRYKCCESCKVKYTDKNGDWGIENNEWCAIKYSCTNEN